MPATTKLAVFHVGWAPFGLEINLLVWNSFVPESFQFLHDILQQWSRRQFRGLENRLRGHYARNIDLRSGGSMERTSTHGSNQRGMGAASPSSSTRWRWSGTLQLTTGRLACRRDGPNGGRARAGRSRFPAGRRWSWTVKWFPELGLGDLRLGIRLPYNGGGWFSPVLHRWPYHARQSDGVLLGFFPFRWVRVELDRSLQQTFEAIASDQRVA